MQIEVNPTEDFEGFKKIILGTDFELYRTKLTFLVREAVELVVRASTPPTPEQLEALNFVREKINVDDNEAYNTCADALEDAGIDPFRLDLADEYIDLIVQDLQEMRVTGGCLGCPEFEEDPES